jgi:mono/diheme cytochrome c family protein
MRRRYILICLLCVGAGLTFSALAQERGSSASPSNAAVPAPPTGTSAVPSAATKSTTSTTAVAIDPAEERALRLEGEKRFRTNCGRCHQAPHKFPPRVMAAAIRHMRVRATITDEDMRLILRYMTR